MSIMNKIMDKHLNIKKEINRLKFKKLILKILTKTLRKNPKKRMNINEIVRYLFQILDL